MADVTVALVGATMLPALFFIDATGMFATRAPFKLR
jgi:hypothetical protein